MQWSDLSARALMHAMLIFGSLAHVGDAMSNLAETYRALGRLEEALVLQEKVLKFRRHVLPSNHPLIGTVQFPRGAPNYHAVVRLTPPFQEVPCTV